MYLLDRGLLHIERFNKINSVMKDSNTIRFLLTIRIPWNIHNQTNNNTATNVI